jgi:hypothetical protein
LKKPFAPFLEQSGTDMVRRTAGLMIIVCCRLQWGGVFMHSLVLAQHVLSTAVNLLVVWFLLCGHMHVHVCSEYPDAVQTPVPPTATAAAWLMCRAVVAQALHLAWCDSNTNMRIDIACEQLAPGEVLVHTMTRAGAVLLCCVSSGA